MLGRLADLQRAGPEPARGAVDCRSRDHPLAGVAVSSQSVSAGAVAATLGVRAASGFAAGCAEALGGGASHAVAAGGGGAENNGNILRSALCSRFSNTRSSGGGTPDRPRGARAQHEAGATGPGEFRGRRRRTQRPSRGVRSVAATSLAGPKYGGAGHLADPQ